MAMLANYILLITNPQRPDKDPPKYGSKVYQVFGFDVLIDRDLKAWLLEINDHPSLNINLEKEGKEIVSEIDKYIKVKVLKEAIQLVNSEEI